MNRSDAIAHMTILTTAHADQIHPLELHATRLGLEALKLIVEITHYDPAYFNLKLPSETV